MAKVKEAPRYAMSDEHKASLAAGREQSRVVRNYLQALQEHRPKRGRKVTPETLEKRLLTVSEQIGLEHDPLKRLELLSERDSLQERLEVAGGDFDLSGLEGEFVRVAAEYGHRRGISYSAWREVGVQPSVLKAAGISRSA